jgi:hypothetical protein
VNPTHWRVAARQTFLSCLALVLKVLLPCREGLGEGRDVRHFGPSTLALALAQYPHPWTNWNFGGTPGQYRPAARRSRR